MEDFINQRNLHIDRTVLSFIQPLCYQGDFYTKRFDFGWWALVRWWRRRSLLPLCSMTVWIASPASDSGSRVVELTTLFRLSISDTFVSLVLIVDIVLPTLTACIFDSKSFYSEMLTSSGLLEWNRLVLKNWLRCSFSVWHGVTFPINLPLEPSILTINLVLQIVSTQEISHRVSFNILADLIRPDIVGD